MMLMGLGFKMHFEMTLKWRKAFKIHSRGLGLLQFIVQENKFSELWKLAKKCGHAKVEEIWLMGIWKIGIWWVLEVGQERWPCKGGSMGIWKMGMWCREITG